MTKKILQSYNFSGNQIIDARFENLAGFPTAGKAGRLVLNTTTSLVGFDDLSREVFDRYAGGATFFRVERQHFDAVRRPYRIDAVSRRLLSAGDKRCGDR